MVALRFDCAPLGRAEQKEPRRSPAAASEPVAPYPSLSRRPFARIPAGAEASACRRRGPCRTARPSPRSLPTTSTHRADSASLIRREGAGHEPSSPTRRSTKTPYVPGRPRGAGGMASPLSYLRTRMEVELPGPTMLVSGRQLRKRPGPAPAIRTRLARRNLRPTRSRAFGASWSPPRRRCARRPSRTSATMRVGSPSGAIRGRTPLCSWRTPSCDCGRV